LPMTNTLAYHENPQITIIKSFTVQAPCLLSNSILTQITCLGQTL
jgi:hypothetical protein